MKGAPASHIKTIPAGGTVRVTLGGELIAESRGALVMKEGSYPPVYYFPRGDVKMDRLVRSSHRTHCPFKGDASYFLPGQIRDQAVLSFLPLPFTRGAASSRSSASAYRRAPGPWRPTLCTLTRAPSTSRNSSSATRSGCR